MSSFPTFPLNPQVSKRPGNLYRQRRLATDLTTFFGVVKDLSDVFETHHAQQRISLRFTVLLEHAQNPPR